MDKILIVGAGISGLSCAYYLKKNGLSPTIYESSSSYGGKIKTETIDDFLLDYGFQVLLNNYKEIKRMGCYENLNINYFDSGASILHENKKENIYNPLYHPIKFLKSDFTSFFTLTDIYRILRLLVSNPSPGTSTNKYLNKYLSDNLNHLFIKPFFRGIFLDDDLQNDLVFFKKLIKKFIFGKAGLPKLGMQELPKSIIEIGDLKRINYNKKLVKIDGDYALFNDNDSHRFDKIILALPIHITSKILNLNVSFSYNSNSTFYFTSDKNVLTKAISLLPDTNFKSNSLQCLTNISKSYSPKGKFLYSLASNKYNLNLERAKYEFELITSLKTHEYCFLKSYNIKNALPKKTKIISSGNEKIHLCGDWSNEPSIDGAVKSGRLTAEAILKESF